MESEGKVGKADKAESDGLLRMQTFCPKPEMPCERQNVRYNSLD